MLMAADDACGGSVIQSDCQLAQNVVLGDTYRMSFPGNTSTGSHLICGTNSVHYVNVSVPYENGRLRIRPTGGAPEHFSFQVFEACEVDLSNKCDSLPYLGSFPSPVPVEAGDYIVRISNLSSEQQSLNFKIYVDQIGTCGNGIVEPAANLYETCDEGLNSDTCDAQLCIPKVNRGGNSCANAVEVDIPISTSETWSPLLVNYASALGEVSEDFEGQLCEDESYSDFYRFTASERGTLTFWAGWIEQPDGNILFQEGRVNLFKNSCDNPMELQCSGFNDSVESVVLNRGDTVYFSISPRYYSPSGQQLPAAQLNFARR